MQASFIAIVPARLESTRLPRKALAMIGPYPLVIHSALRARESGADRVVIATDHEDIAAIAREHQFDYVMTGVNHPSGTDRLAEAVKRLDLDDTQIVVNVQGDEPFMNPQVIRRVVERLSLSPECVMSSACYPILEEQQFLNPNVVKVILDHQQRALYFSRSPIPYVRATHNTTLPKELKAWHHMGLYAYRVSFLKEYQALPVSPLETNESLEQLRVLWHGFKIAMEITENAPLAGVDTPEDLERVREWFQQQNQH